MIGLWPRAASAPRISSGANPRQTFQQVRSADPLAAPSMMRNLTTLQAPFQSVIAAKDYPAAALRHREGGGFLGACVFPEGGARAEVECTIPNLSRAQPC